LKIPFLVQEEKYFFEMSRADDSGEYSEFSFLFFFLDGGEGSSRGENVERCLKALFFFLGGGVEWFLFFFFDACGGERF